MTELDRPPAPAPASPATAPAAAAMREHQRGLWRFLRVLGARDDEAADLLQETFVQMLRTPFEDRGPAALHRWLRTTARNLFYAHCRSVRRSPIALDPTAVEAALARYERDDDGAGYRHALARCLETLPQRQRELLEAHVGGTDLPTLAAGHDLAPEALRSLLRRCKQVLRTCIDRRLHDEPR